MKFILEMPIMPEAITKEEKPFFEEIEWEDTIVFKQYKADQKVEDAIGRIVEADYIERESVFRCLVEFNEEQVDEGLETFLLGEVCLEASFMSHRNEDGDLEEIEVVEAWLNPYSPQTYKPEEEKILDKLGEAEEIEADGKYILHLPHASQEELKMITDYFQSASEDIDWLNPDNFLIIGGSEMRIYQVQQEEVEE